MTNGDFVYFTWYPLRTLHTDKPWRKYRRYLDAGDVPRFRQALSVVKQVGCRNCRSGVRV